MTPLSDSEARTVARFENAEPAPESWGGGLRDRAARNATCCDHAASDHDTHGCAVNLSTHSRTYERCHGLVAAGARTGQRCTDCGRALTDSHEERTSGLCLRCLNGPVPDRTGQR